MDLQKLLFRLGIQKTAVNTGNSGQAHTLTLFEKEQTVKILRSTFGSWLNIPGRNVQIITDEHELPLVPATRTVYVLHNPYSAVSMTQLRSLLNFLKRKENYPADILIFDIHLLNDQLRNILLGNAALPLNGAAVVIEKGEIRYQLISKEDFLQFRADCEANSA
ncbi:MAG: hypothetical protein Fur0041_13260 [Bacteroidia bacterium]